LARKSLQKLFTFQETRLAGGDALTTRLLVDGEAIDLNDFVEKILSGTIVGAVTSLRDIKKDWKKIEILVTK